MFKWIVRSWFSCRKYNERLSNSFQQPLSGWEKLGYWVHHISCRRCRVAKTQIIILNETLARYGKSLADSKSIGQEATPSSEFIAKLKQKILQD